MDAALRRGAATIHRGSPHAEARLAGEWAMRSRYVIATNGTAFVRLAFAPHQFVVLH